MSKNEKNPLLLILIIINSIVVVFILVKQFSIDETVEKMTIVETAVSGDSFKSPHFPEAKESYTIVEYPFGNFTANLARPSGPQRFIKLTLTLLVETPLNNNLSEIINKTPSLRDEIISILNTTKPKDVLKLEGREVLKNILKEHINGKLKDDNVKRVLFTQFTIS
ncbi:MAG: flagellar basal body-associated FliL family protein [Bacteriovoracaceae bacterium]|nr:flagellar basal body-associated FliL family protein [Bacteriovoracaceae bacterium]